MKTSIQIDKTTRERLKQFKIVKRETFDEELNRFMDKEDKGIEDKN